MTDAPQDHFMFELRYDDAERALIGIASALLPLDRICIELCDTESGNVLAAWRRYASGADGATLWSEICNRARTVQCDAPIVVFESVGSTEQHWRHWLPSLSAMRLNANRMAELQSLQSEVAANARKQTMLDCAARTLHDALQFADERAVERERAQEDVDSALLQSGDARKAALRNVQLPKVHWQVMFAEPLPPKMLPLLLARVPVMQAGRLRNFPHTIYAVTLLGSVIEVTPYGASDATFLPIRKTHFCVDNSVTPYNSPSGTLKVQETGKAIAAGKRPFEDFLGHECAF